MNRVTHALTVNGQIHGELKDPLDPPDEIIRKRLNLLDGKDRYAWSLWRLPVGVALDQVNLKKWPQEFIQIAGSQQCATIEVRMMEGKLAHHYVVGHPYPDSQNLTEVIVPRGGGETTVMSNEVFDVEEAAELFFAYYATDRVPETCVLRPLVT